MSVVAGANRDETSSSGNIMVKNNLENRNMTTTANIAGPKARFQDKTLSKSA